MAKEGVVGLGAALPVVITLINTFPFPGNSFLRSAFILHCLGVRGVKSSLFACFDLVDEQKRAELQVELKRLAL